MLKTCHDLKDVHLKNNTNLVKSVKSHLKTGRFLMEYVPWARSSDAVDSCAAVKQAMVVCLCYMCCMWPGYLL